MKMSDDAPAMSPTHMLGTRVMCFVNLLQPFFDHVRVDLRRGNIGVAQHQLDRAQICAALQKMRCKTVAQHVRGRTNTQSGLTPIRRENLPNTDAAERRTTAVNEKRCRESLLPFSDKPGTGVAKIPFDKRKCLLANRNDALFVSLTDAANAADAGVEIHDAKIDKFGDAQTGGVEDFEHGAIAKTERCLDRRAD